MEVQVHKQGIVILRECTVVFSTISVQSIRLFPSHQNGDYMYPLKILAIMRIP